MSTSNFSDETLHRRLGIDLYNYCWTLLEATPVDADELERAALASLFHWSKGGGNAGNLSIGEWMASHAYVILERPEGALYHGRRCLEITTEAGLTGFHLAFAHETLARANALAGEMPEAKWHYDEARRVADAMEDPEDREVFDPQFSAGPWFGLSVA